MTNIGKAIVFAAALIFSSQFFVSNVGIVRAETNSKLEAAIDAWLDDNDQVAIPQLSKLAHDGNEMAMILLGQIAKMPGNLSPYLKKLPLKERIALLKAPNGKFHVSWLKRAKKNRELAQALLGIDDPDNRFANVLLLLELGERGQALRAYSRLIDYGVPKYFSNSIANLPLPREMGPFKWYAATYEDADVEAIKQALSDMADSTLNTYTYLSLIYHLLDVRGQNGIDFKLITTVLRGDSRPEEGNSLEDTNVLNDRAFEILRIMPELQPLRVTCSRFCPEQTDTCLRTSYRLIGGYFGLLQVQSPSETIIPEDRYFLSKRISYDMLRQMGAFFDPYWIDNRPEIVNKCVARLVYEQSSYKPYHFSEQQKRFLGVQ